MIFRLLDRWLGLSAWKLEAPSMFDGALAWAEIEPSLTEEGAAHV